MLKLHLALIKVVGNKTKIGPGLSDSILLYWGQVIPFIRTRKEANCHMKPGIPNDFKLELMH